VPLKALEFDVAAVVEPEIAARGDDLAHQGRHRRR
jgi:hypothetical protein